MKKYIILVFSALLIGCTPPPDNEVAKCPIVQDELAYSHNRINGQIVSEDDRAVLFQQPDSEKDSTGEFYNIAYYMLGRECNKLIVYRTSADDSPFYLFFTMEVWLEDREEILYIDLDKPENGLLPYNIPEYKKNEAAKEWEEYWNQS